MHRATPPSYVRGRSGSLSCWEFALQSALKLTERPEMIHCNPTRRRHPRNALSVVILLLIFLLQSIAGCAPRGLAGEIRAVLDRQSAAWNRADLNGFMDGYWKSDELTFESMGRTGMVSVTRGWQATLDRYKSRYDTPAKIGRLTFTDLAVTPDGPDRATVTGRYELARTDGRDGGTFVLTWRRIDGRWVIVHDRTTADPVERK